LKGEKIEQYETRRLHKDGRLLDVSLSEAPVHDASGKIIGVAAIERNISERLRTRALETQMAAIVKSTTDAIYSLGPGHMVTSWNPGAERLFGYRAEEVLGKPSPTMMPEVRDQLDEMLRRVLDGGETVEFESRRRRKDGNVLDVSVTASPIYDNSGMANGLAVVARDITERKRTERALVAAQQELRSRMRQQAVVARLGQRALGKIEPHDFMAEAAALIAETLAADTCAIAQLQPDGKTLLLQAAVGCPQGMVGAATADSNQDSQAAYTLLDPQPVVVRDFATETRFQRSAFLGSVDAVSGLSVLIPVSEGPQGIIAVSTRSTREFSRDDVNFVQALAHIVAQVLERRRTEQELKAARDEALDSARAKSAFLANMSHEIRTPLNSIVGLSSLLVDTPLNPEQRDFAETIRVSSDVLLETINNVLDFTKFSTGKLVLEHAEFDTRTVTQTALELVTDAARKKQLELLLFVDGQVPRVLRGDPGRLRQVLVNLLSNAVKFTARGEVVVRVTLEREAGKKSVIRFEVSDTGLGIPEQAQRRLFQPFYQADSSTTRRYGGTGLGLAISAQLVELMGGRIGVTSRPGEGSTFWFTISLEKSAIAAMPAPAEGLANLHVLIVDDNATSRQIVRQQMQSWGARAECAAGAAQALSMMRHEADIDPYAVAVVDFQMPEIDGLELAQRIKADSTLSKIHVMMMSSGGGRKEDDPRAAALDAWLSKPIKMPELFSCLTRLERVREQAGAPAPKIEPAASVVQAGAKVTTASPADGGRILLAEDNPVNQKVAVLQLKKLGYQVDVAGNGRDALAALERGRYEVVLMDCQMPEMDGYEATGEIRKREAGSSKHTIVIAMTAFGLSGDREKCLSAGMDDYVSKPARMEVLKEVLERWAPSKKTAVSAHDAKASANTSAPAPPLDRPPDR
jgi:PAS domain S-box-containing protein